VLDFAQTRALAQAQGSAGAVGLELQLLAA